jgi:hypothetical protein
VTILIPPRIRMRRATMKALRRLALVALGVAAAACASARPAAGPETASGERGVEVVNSSHQRVNVYGFVPGATSSEYLGTVAAGSSRRFPLPSMVQSVSVRTTDGRSVDNKVRVRHIRL